MTECPKCRAREINGTLRTYDGYVPKLEAEIERLVEVIDSLLTAPDAQCFSEARVRAEQMLKEHRGENE